MRGIPSSAIDKHEIHSQEKSLTETKNSLPLGVPFQGLAAVPHSTQRHLPGEVPDSNEARGQ